MVSCPDIDGSRGTAAIACAECRHRSGVGFEGLSAAETEFMSRFKVAHELIPAGGWVGAEGGPFLLTLYSGWALRCRGEGTGWRAVGISLPGELIGLETLTGAAKDVRLRALTDVTICRFQPRRLGELLAVPSLAGRMARLEALARIETEERLMAAGRSATANVCHFILTLHRGLMRRRLAGEGGFRLPVALTTVAQCLNLTPVHFRRVLRRLEADGVLSIDQQRVIITDPEGLRARAGAAPETGLRPLL